MLVSRRAEKLFIEAHALDPDTRVQFVTDACGEDKVLLDEVSSLLAAANESENYFNELSGKISLSALADGGGALPENTVFGQWRLLRLLGSGGMGSVYLVERADEQFEQRAALKVLPVGLGGAQGHARFLMERQILARLVHDNIARLLDGGVTESGVPYFVMDYVDGVPIDAFCEAQQLSVDARLALVLEIADAVQYAHRNLVVHRDLKPGNVLVEEAGHVRLLDFGIAKVLEPDADDNLTRVSQRPATPAYASPEMLRGEPVDATTDVYSIGVLIYALLTGRLPLSFDGLSLADMHERVLAEVPPPASRYSDRVDNELDAIVAKALAKDPEERYASVEGLANDIRNYLDGLPVNARAPSAMYRAGKFIGRHKAGASFAAFAVIALASITGLAVNAAITAERQSQTIALERDRAEEIRDFLISIFNSADPNRAPADVTARELLDAGRQRIATELAEQPELQVDLAMTIGEVYATFRMTDEWREMLEMELDLRRDIDGTDHIDYVDTLFGMSQLEDMTGNYDASQAYAQEALEITERLDHLLGQAFAHKRLGRILHLKGDYESADKHYRRSLAINEDELGANDVETNKIRMHLSTLLNHQQKYEEALAMLERVYSIRQEHYPGDHSEYSEVFLATGSVMNALGRYDEATATYDKAFAMNERLFGADNRRNVFIVNGLGKVAEAQGDYALAAERYRDAVRMTALFFPDHANLGFATANLAKAHTLNDRWDLALPKYREAVAILERKIPDHWRLGDVRWRLGRCIVQTDGDFAEAESLIVAGIDTLNTQWGPDYQAVKDAEAAAEELYIAWGKPTEAQKYLSGSR